MLLRKSMRGACAAPRRDGNAVYTWATAAVSLRDSTAAVSLMTATADQALGLWVRVAAGTLVASAEAVTQNCTFDTQYIGVPIRRLC